MTPAETLRPHGGFAALRQLIKPNRGQEPPGEHCEMCAVLLAEQHPHLVEIATRRLVCSCDACALLFDNPAQLKYRRVPRRIRRLVDFQLWEAQWSDLLIPINMAFFFHSTPSERVVAMYPSPAGAVESLLPLESWTGMVAENPLLATMEPDVEALLVNRLAPKNGFSEPEYYLAPIDECYKLVGLLRMNWRGLSGGSEVWEHIQRYFVELRQRSTPVEGDRDTVERAPS
jgi:hypothetical protein